MTRPVRTGIRRALVTGASGFIGSHLVDRLLDEGVRVRALVRDPVKAGSLAARGVEIARGDVTQPDCLDAAVDGMDTVFHLAAIVGPAAVSLEAFEAVNAGGTRNLLHACRAASAVTRVVHVSTVAVTEGPASGKVVTEESRPAPTTRYGRSKWAAEQIALDASRRGLPLVVARPMWVYGWRSPGAVKLFQLIARRRMVLIGAARNSIQPISVDDVVDGLLRAAAVPGVEGQVYQFAGPEAITMKALCGDVAKALGVPAPSIHIPLPIALAAAAALERCYPASRGKPPIDRNKIAIFRTDHSYATDKARRDLGWTPTVRFPEGATRTAAAMRDRGMLP